MIPKGRTMYVPPSMRKHINSMKDMYNVKDGVAFDILGREIEEEDLFTKIRNKRLNNRGSLEGLIAIITALFMLGIFVYIVYFMGGQVITTLSGITEVNSVALAQQTLTDGQGWLQKTDLFSILLLLGFYLVIILTSYIVPVATVNSPIFILGFILVEMISGIISYTWYKFTTTTTTFAATLLAMPITDHILTYLPLYILVAGIISMVLTYGRGDPSNL